MTLTARAQIVISATESGALDLSTLRNDLAQSVSKQWADGTGNDQVNALYADRITLTASGTQDIDLAGVLTDAFGVALSLTKVKAVFFHASINNNVANAVRVTRPASNGFPLFIAAGDGVDLPADGKLYIEWPKAGVAVVAGTGDLITLTNTAGTNTVDVDVIILGTK